ncbi:BTAD domain-containing putative transcriptional regulator [Actinoplanes sp. NPDC051494]|uniref:AfsR/SARP family transcriptional regulator n=1 Tax=Actinoplanes sp. NPDC051494 TaxID=3363907 RepID=UPI00379DB2EC
MRFRLLGTVEVWSGQSVPLGGPKPRTVLAALLLNRDHAVPESTLIDLTWGEQPPAGARRQLQLYVSRLRKILGGASVTRRGEGYELSVGPEELDLNEFDAVTELARADLAAGRLERTVTRLRGALKLWRGNPLHGTSRLLAEREGPALAERRLTALEALFETELQLGGHARVLADLYRIAAEEPYREKFQAQLMLALHEGGRTEAALRVHAEARRRLSTDLGIDPGRYIVEAHLRILRGGDGPVTVAPWQWRRSPALPHGLVDDAAPVPMTPEPTTMLITK